MKPVNPIGRRIFLYSGLCSGLLAATKNQQASEAVFRLATPEWDIRLTIEFHDRQSSRRFAFLDRQTDRRFCLSGAGQESANCLKNFVGSIAIARYRMKCRQSGLDSFILREKVRTIDADDQLPQRQPFERTLESSQGVVSDIQAFGYEDASPPKTSEETEAFKGPWSLLRQELYVAQQTAPFLVVHWKHTLSEIRVVDLIPGTGTSLLNQTSSIMG